ncbi:MAG: dephospho-CoA kinase [Fusicatenibacter sp.]|nr:dephospho-CoA kinase [Fusicatenibacter sp.]
MKVIGITGGVGAGKTEVMTYIGSSYDATVIQADEVGYLLMQPGKECYGPIIRLFGQQVTTVSGELNRKRIADVVFRDQEKLKQLNDIVHPAVKQYIRNAIEKERHHGTEFVFIEAALLIEDKYDEICDELWYIYADEEIRKERLMSDRGYSSEKISGIMANQLSEEQFCRHCDFEIDNSGDFGDTKKQIDQRMKKYETL